MSLNAHTAKKQASQFSSREFGFWLYLMTDAILFALLFATYVVMSRNVADGPSGQEVFDISHTFGETLLLLLSSLTFGFASLSLAAGRQSMIIGWLVITILLGLGFVAMEISEFQEMIAIGAGPDVSGFLSAFFALVGTHGLHVSLGMVGILVIIGQLLVKGPTDAVQSRFFRLGLFWHFLDIVWIGIFSVVYLPAMV
jgi:cytochrome o ubiquinol oxidase subunit III